MTLVSQQDLIAGAIAGKLVSFPTDTIPALAVLPERSELIFVTKKRPQTKPLILMGTSWEELLPYVTGTATELEIWQQVTQKYWPGVLTLVLPASDAVPRAMNPHDSQSIGIRVPNQSIALDILSQTGPLATTSVNLSGEPPLVAREAIEAVFPQVLILDCQEKEDLANLGSGKPSTVAKWTGTGWQILRQGNIQLT